MNVYHKLSYIVIGGIILLSFFSFSYVCYPFFNSDSALAVLMSYDYKLPRDLYCWGQDRGGTLEIMIAHFFIVIFKSGPIQTASVIHFLILTGGLLSSFHFVKNPFNRLGLAIVWFFPSIFFLEIIIYQFGIQFSLFMAALYFLSKAIQSAHRKNLLLSVSCFLMILNAWVLDLGFIPVFLLLAFAAYHFIRKGALPEGVHTLLNKKNIILLSLWIAAGLGFFIYAKINASVENSFSGIAFNDIPGFFTVAASIFNLLIAHFILRGKPMECLYTYSAVIFILTLAFQKYEKQDSWSLFFTRFFFWQSVAGFILLMFVKQVEMSGVPARYFAGCYLSFAMYAFMKLDALPDGYLPSRIAMVMVLVSTVLSSVYENYLPKRLPPMVQNFHALDSLKPVGIIGSYWNSYVFGAIDPENIKASPHDKDNVRNKFLAYFALEQPTLLLIRNEWMENFPDSISQFGTPLVKKGKPFSIGTYIVWEEVNDVIACEYEMTR